VITKDKTGKRKTYIFNLRYARNSDAAVALVDFIATPIEVTTNPVANISVSRQEIDASNQERRVLVGKLSYGLGKVIDQGYLKDYSTKQIDAIKQMIGSVYQGIPLMEAIERHGVDAAVVSRIILMGS
jgi:ABC-type Fe3+ transport system substrate-binding protein